MRRRPSAGPASRPPSGPRDSGGAGRGGPVMARRRWLQAVAASGLGGLLGPGRAQPSPRPPAELDAELPGARLLGQGRMRHLGFAVYDARLWAGPGFRAADFARHAFALELQYLRRLEGAAIADRSLVEMGRVGTVPDAQAGPWRQALREAFPDVAAGDRLTGLHRPAGPARFFHNGRLTGEIRDADFAPLFFAIWLSPATPEPALRRALLQGAGEGP